MKQSLLALALVSGLAQAEPMADIYLATERTAKAADNCMQSIMAVGHHETIACKVFLVFDAQLERLLQPVADLPDTELFAVVDSGLSESEQSTFAERLYSISALYDLLVSQ